MQPQLQSLSGHEAERISVRVERLQLSDAHAGLGRDQGERVARPHEPVRRRPAGGCVWDSRRARLLAGLAGSAEHDGGRGRGGDRDGQWREIARNPAPWASGWRELDGHRDSSSGGRRLFANCGASDRGSPAAGHRLRRSRARAASTFRLPATAAFEQTQIRCQRQSIQAPNAGLTPAWRGHVGRGGVASVLWIRPAGEGRPRATQLATRA